MKIAKAALCSAAALFVMSAPVSAAVIQGQLNISGSAAIGDTTIDVLPVGGGLGVIGIEPASNGDFLPYGNTVGTMADLDILVQPVGSPFVMNNFITLAAAPNLDFVLTFIEPGVFTSAAIASPPAPGQTATPPGSPFNLVNTTASSSTASFVVRGYVVDIADPSQQNPFIGVYTAQFSSQSFQELLAVADAGGTIDTAFSATLTVIPEPATLSVLAIGSLGLMLRRRRA